MSKFADDLHELCRAEHVGANGDPARITEMLERLASALSATIAFSVRGNAEAADRLVVAAENYIATEVTRCCAIAVSLGGKPEARQ